MRKPLVAVLRAGAVAALAMAFVTSIGQAQTGVHPVTGRRYARRAKREMIVRAQLTSFVDRAAATADG